MGEYEPEDSRNVTRSTDTAPGEPPRTGPREGEARRQAEQGESAEDRELADAKAQPGYGNARDADGEMEQDEALRGD